MTDNNVPPDPIRIAIVGGGIGGLCLLLGILHHCGVPSSSTSSSSKHTIIPHLYESVPAFSEIGAGIGFGHNAVPAMELVDPRLRAAYYRVAADATKFLNGDRTRTIWHEWYMGMEWRGSTNNYTSPESDECNAKTLRAGEKIGEMYWKNVKKNVHRARLLDEMVKLLPGGTGEGFVTFNKKATEIEDLGGSESGVRLHFADGMSEDFDAVIGCDGVKSRIRQILLAGEENIEPRFTGKYAYRGLVPMHKAENALGEEMARKSHMFWGYKGHLVNYPIEKGNTVNVVAFRTKDDGKWDHGSQWVVPSTTEEAEHEFQDWIPQVRALVALMEKPNKWGLFEHPPASTYCREGRICLLGDCAHASSPHQGAGAGMAIEDAAVMSILLKNMLEQKSSRPSLKKVFHAYDAVRRPRTQKLVTTSRDAGELFEFQKEGVWDDKELLVSNMNERMHWIWDIDLDQHVQEAIGVMNRVIE